MPGIRRPAVLDLAGHAVHLQGFVSPDPPTLVVVDDSGGRVTMRVVPPDTDDATAAELMAAAATHHSGHDEGGPATNADAAAATSLDEVATRLARLPGNTDPAQARRSPGGSPRPLISSVRRPSRCSSRSSSSTSSVDVSTATAPIAPLAAWIDDNPVAVAIALLSLLEQNGVGCDGEVRMCAVIDIADEQRTWWIIESCSPRTSLPAAATGVGSRSPGALRCR